MIISLVTKFIKERLGFANSQRRFSVKGEKIHEFTSRNVQILEFRNITEIFCEKINKITYDEIFLILISEDKVLTCGELDDGFATVESALIFRFPSLNNWRIKAENSGYERTILLEICQ
jgi:hypothetical protein